VTYKRFEELPVWQKAIELAEKVYHLTRAPAFKSFYSLKDQLERAALSVSNNIAEGFERGTTQELLTFLYIARGSSGEVRSMLCFIERLPEFRSLLSEILDLKVLSEGISRQLRAWADTLQNSDIPGQRYLTDKERKHYEHRKQQKEFLQKLKEIAEQARKKPET
jgi:four helix bundle protein